MKPNPLIGLPSPRDIPEFLEAFAKVKCHKFWAKYYTEQVAYEHIRDYFLANTEYTHLIILPDDEIITQAHLDKLMSEIEKNDYPILCGVMMVNRESIFDGQTNISTTTLPPIDRGRRIYDLMTLKEWESYPEPKPVVKIAYQGFPMLVIRRDVVEKIPFRDDRSHRATATVGCCVDLMFCLDATAAGYEMYADLSVFVTHMGMNYRFDPRFFHVGVYPSEHIVDKSTAFGE